MSDTFPDETLYPVLTSIADEDRIFASNSAVGHESSQIKGSTIKGLINALKGTPPETLDTLQKLAAAINNDPNFHTTLATALAEKAPLANPEFTGTPRSPTLLTKPTSNALWVIYNPPGGGFVGDSGASLLSNGIIEIKLPSPGSGQAFIARMQIEVFDYQSHQSYTVITEGFWQNTNQWTRQSSQVVFPQGTVKKEVVVGHGIAADGRPVIQLETLAITRAFLRVSIPWVMITWITDPAPFLNQWAIATIRDSNPSTIHSTRTCYPSLNAAPTQTINGQQFFRNAQGNVMYGPLTPTSHDPLCFGCGDTLMWKFRQETSGTLAFYHWDGSAFSKAAEWNPSTKSMDLLNEPTAPTAAPGTNTTQLANCAFVQAALTGASGVPAGVICMWSGTIATVPSGWALCDGANGTPDLVDRFVVAAGVKSGGDKYDPGDTGGLDSVKLTLTQVPAHTHAGTTNPAGGHGHDAYYWDGASTGSGPMIDKRDNVNNNWDALSSPVSPVSDHTHGFTTDSKGGGGSHENRPPYYALAFIMKL